MTDDEIYARIMASIDGTLRRARRLQRDYERQATEEARSRYDSAARAQEPGRHLGEQFGIAYRAIRDVYRNITAGFRATAGDPPAPAPPVPATEHAGATR